MVVDRQCVGYLELCEIGRPFSQVDSKALEQASMAVALKLLTDQRNAELRRQEREEYFADVLYGRRDVDALRKRAESFGFDADSRHVVLRVQYDESGERESSTGRARRSRVLTALARQLDTGYRAIASTSVPGADLVLLGVPATETGAADGALGDALRATFPEIASGLAVRHLVVSEVCRSLRDLPMNSERLRDTAALLRETRSAPRLAFARDLELVCLLSRRDGVAGAQRHADDLFAPLVEHDSASGGALLETLIAFVQCQAQIRATATHLAVHENTVRYRLNRIRELSSIEPERLDSLLSVSLALQVRGLLAGSELVTV
jgi:sugar diacid utilization regulator